MSLIPNIALIEYSDILPQVVCNIVQIGHKNDEFAEEAIDSRIMEEIKDNAMKFLT